MVGGVDSAGVDVVVYADGANLYRVTSSGSRTTLTWGGSGSIMALATDGVNYYVANSVGIYQGPLTGASSGTSIFTHPTTVGTVANVAMSWVKQRLIAGVNNYVFQIVPIVTHTITATEIVNNVATATITPANNFRVGDPITISGVGTTGAAYNGTWVVSAVPSANTVSWSHAHADQDYNTNTGSLVLSNNNSNPIYAHPTATWKFTSIVEGPTAIYVGGYSGTTSTILKLTLDNSGTVPSLVSATSAADLPNDELVTSLGCYLGKFVLIGTNKGIRVGTVDSSAYGQGFITYGPLTYKKPDGTNYVSAFAFSDRFAYATVTNSIDDLSGTINSGLIRIDLSALLSDAKYAWTYDLNSGVQGACKGIAFIGTTGRLAFTVDSQGLYFQHATNKVASGYIDTGAIRYNTIENKHFKLFKPLVQEPFYGSLGLSTIYKDGTVNPIITIGSAPLADQDFATNVTTPQSQLAFRFTLNRSGTDNTKGPSITGFQTKSLPANKRTRSLEIPLMNYDFESDRYNIATGYEGRAWDRLQALEQIESAGNIITIQDFTSNEQVQGLIEQISFERMTSPDRRFKGYGGIVYVQVRTI